jgi:aspartate-semialdehyde dehydrogenase
VSASISSAPAPGRSPGNRAPVSAPNVAVVGATGAVGQEFLNVLAQRNFPIGDLKLLASARSAGKTETFKGKTYKIEELTEASFKGVDIALFSAGGSISKKFGPIAAQGGAVVVDNSSAFRQSLDVPLIVPEVNPQDMAHVKIGKGAIIANPNCSTIIALVPVTPLHKAAGVKRMVVSTYQAASGAGYAAMCELEDQTRDVLAGKPAQSKIFKQQYAFNLFSHNSGMGPNGYNEEEMKMVHETLKMWGYNKGTGAGVAVDPPNIPGAPKIAATCVRVPVMRAHAESITLTLGQAMSEDEAREILSKAPGVSLIDDRASNTFPTPLDASGKDDVYVGRIRRDLSQDGDVGLSLFVCGDQLRKGAALNAVQIAELLL